MMYNLDVNRNDLKRCNNELIDLKARYNTLEKTLSQLQSAKSEFQIQNQMLHETIKKMEQKLDENEMNFKEKQLFNAEQTTKNVDDLHTELKVAALEKQRLAKEIL